MLRQALRIGTFAFPAWVLLASLLALWRPGIFTWFSGGLITVGLGVIMLGMGLTLEVDDFRRVLRRPAPIGLGVVLQYVVMPLMGWTVAWALDLPREFAVGLILVSCCPGGVASNVISYLALADVPLSVSMTAVSTGLSVLMTPALMATLASSRIDVPAAGLLLSTVQVVILPIVTGLVLRRYAQGLTRAVLPYGPFTSVVLITLIVASIIGSSRAIILESGDLLVVAVFGLHAGGFFLGYALARLVSRRVPTARTVSIEVGMQNSGLGVVLAGQNFTSPLVAVPSAISSLFHSLIGSVVAGVWRASAVRHAARRPDPEQRQAIPVP
ncbi:MAG: bile acid:sodium symporter family protein [Acidobacteriota bacterium]|nr:bile acid:sodium symporter family protein [Acidobacteriota bacterium]